jgi:hypothetical protein
MVFTNCPPGPPPPPAAGGGGGAPPWYFQQFLKMAYSFKSETQYYLIWDSDTIPLNPIHFFINDGDKLKCMFTMKDEHHVPYFKTINVLFDGKVFKLTNKSFIAEHMMIDKDIMLEIIHKIDDNAKIPGNNFFEKILYAIDRNEISSSGFSEFETYGNYVLKYYPEKYCLRQLRTFREGSLFVDKPAINERVLNWIAKSYDTISFEHHGVSKNMASYKRFFGWVVTARIMPFKFYCKIPRIPIVLKRLR